MVTHKQVLLRGMNHNLVDEARKLIGPEPNYNFLDDFEILTKFCLRFRCGVKKSVMSYTRWGSSI